MEILLIRYYNVNRFLLSLVGLWPFQKKIVQQIQNIFVHIVLTSSVLVQIFKLITSETSFELYMNVLTYAIICLVYVSRYITFIFQLQNIKSLVTRICNNWDVLVDEKEYEIMDRYALKGKKFTLVCMILTSTVITVLFLWTVSLFLLDRIAPLNGSSHIETPFLAEYFVDEEVYLYYILVHMYSVLITGLIVTIATETFYATCVIHACGLFYMAGYHFEQAFKENVLGLLPCTKKYTKMSEKIVRAIEAHINAIEFVDHMNSCFSSCYFILLILAVASLTLNVIAMLQAIKADDIYDALHDFTCVFNVTCYMFCASYCGQKLIDSSTSISKKVYNLPWFLAPPKMQGLLLLVIQRSLKGSALVLGSLFPVSFEFFALVLKMTACYITSLRALQ